MSKPDVATRERTILKYLRERPDDGAPIRDIYEHAMEQLNDNVTLTAYYKIIDRMQAADKIEVLREDPERGRIYGVMPTLHSGSPITLDDIYEMLPYVATTESLARIVDAQDYYEEHRQTVLKQAAEALLDENPLDLFCGLILDMVDVLQKDLGIIRHRNDEGVAEIADSYAQFRVQESYRELEQLAYRGLSLPHSALKLPGLHQAIKYGKPISYNTQVLREVLQMRIFGQTFIREINASTAESLERRERLTVAGSDGSMHAGTLAIQSAKGHYEEVSDVITFNNGIVCVFLSPLQEISLGRKDMVHSAPFTRQTLDDPSYKGMVLAPALFPELSESEYEHMARCASDVVQFRVDEAVFSGRAYDLRAPYSLIPKPQLLIRDGTITPQEREFVHYNRPDAYGEMVREGIRLERIILERSLAADHHDRPPIFAGVVKTTHTHIFGRVLNWYIAHGSRQRFGNPLDPGWDYSRAADITDNAAMTMLLSTLPNRMMEGKYHVTCAILRQFASLTEYYGHDLSNMDWIDYFRQKREDALRDSNEYGGSLSYHATVELEDDDFIFMCKRADFVSFYIGHTDMEPPPMVPRYEFLTSLRQYTENADPNERDIAIQRVDTTVRQIVEALNIVGLAEDRDHNFMTGKSLVKVLPFPIQRAHEYAKSLGAKLESELKSIVISRLIQIKRLRAGIVSDIEIRPIGVRRYLERFARARGKLIGDAEDDAR